jgi:hypothetical protein
MSLIRGKYLLADSGNQLLWFQSIIVPLFKTDGHNLLSLSPNELLDISEHGLIGYTHLTQLL